MLVYYYLLKNGNVTDIKDVLVPFKIISDSMGGDQYPTLSAIYPNVSVLKDLCKPDQTVSINISINV